MTGKQSSPALAHAAQDLIDRGDAAGALAMLAEAAIANDPDSLAAKASAYLALGEAADALASSREAMRLNPAHPAAAFNAGRALMMLGEPEQALTAFAAAEKAFPNVAEIAARLGEAAYLSGDAGFAEEAFRRALAQSPAHAVAFSLLAELLLQRKDQPGLELLLSSAAQRGGAAAYRAASALGRLGRRREALALLEKVQNETGPAAAIDMLAAELLREETDLARALERARAAAARAPDAADAHAPLARLLLITGAAKEAEKLCRKVLAAAHDHQLWLAFLWTSLAAQGSAEANDLLCLDRDVGVIDLEPPPIFSSVEAFNAALDDELRPLHRASGAPLGQSVHGGSQTRRPLQTLGSAAIAAFFAEARRSVESFAARLPEAPNHPFLGRRRERLTVSGAWSVELGPGGRHVSHVHPGGWVSSAYYVATPPSVLEDNGEAGRLLLGEPPFAVPGVETPRRIIAPRPGRLILFPSFCWHGTIPFTGPGRRLTIAFDVAAN